MDDYIMSEFLVVEDSRDKKDQHIGIWLYSDDEGGYYLYRDYPIIEPGQVPFDLLETVIDLIMEEECTLMGFDYIHKFFRERQIADRFIDYLEED